MREYSFKDHYKETVHFLGPGMNQISENISDVESDFQALPPAGLEWWIQEGERLL